MVFRMKTTLVIHDQIMKRVKQEAAKQGLTMSELVEAALRRFLEEQKRPKRDLPPLPVFNMGKFLVDISNREALYDAMEKEEETP
jgi:hypothetical protein